MYFNRAGLLEGLIKALKVIGYVAAAGAITALIDYLSSMTLDPSNYVLVAFVGLVNALLAFLLRWLSIKK